MFSVTSSPLLPPLSVSHTDINIHLTTYLTYLLDYIAEVCFKDVVHIGQLVVHIRKLEHTGERANRELNTTLTTS